jgi:hypothetical protein
MNDKKNRIPLWVKIVWIVIALLILSCAYPVIRNSIRRSRIKPLQQVTHERVADLEQYVYDNVGSDIFFDDPKIDDKNRDAVLTLHVENRGNAGMYDMARCSINNFLEDNPDYFLNDEYHITLVYSDRDVTPDGQDGFYEICKAYNYYDFNGYTENGHESFSVMYDAISVIGGNSYYNYRYYYNSEKVKFIIAHGYSISNDQILDIVSEAPDLEYFYITSRDDDTEILIASMREINQTVKLLWLYE